MLYYADLKDRKSETKEDVICPSCGRPLNQTFVAEENRWYIYCDKCKVIRCLVSYKKE